MRFYTMLITVVTIVLIGCSGSGVNNPVLPDHPQSMNTPSPSHNLWGLWQFTADPDAGTLDITQLRTGMFHANVVPFLEPPAGLKLGVSNIVFDGLICDVDVRLVHPFPGLSQYTGFDVAGILMSSGTMMGFNDTDIVMSGDGDTRLLNADGLTRWWNPAEFDIPGAPILRYRDGLLGNPNGSVGYNCTLNGYKLFGDELSLNTDLLEIDPLSRIPFSHGYTNERHYTIDFEGGLVFNYAVDANWEEPGGTDPYELEDFPEEANRAEAWNVTVYQLENTLYNNGLGDNGGNLSLQIGVMDHFNAGLNTVWVDSPGNFDFATSPGPSGSGGGYSVYEVDIVDATPGPGSVEILIGVESEVVDYWDVLVGEPLTAYFTYTAVVVTDVPSIEVLIPNGGEIYDGFTVEEITWFAPPSVSTVDIFYSKDDFAADNNLIQADAPNTGSYNWDVPNDPSDTVKIRVADSAGPLEDESDDYFTIIEAGCDFEGSGFSLDTNHGPIPDARTYFGIIASQQDTTQRIFCVDSSPSHTINAYNGSNPTAGPIASYDTGDLIYCNNNQAMWIDAYSVPGVDRIIYVNFGGGSPTPGYQIQSLDWNGTSFVNHQTLPKSGSVWNACIATDGDIILHNAQSLTPTFFRYDKANGYSFSTMFMLNPSVIPITSVSNIKGIRYSPTYDGVFLWIRNTAVSSGGQLYLVSSTGSVLYSDTNVFPTAPSLDYMAGIAIDLDSPECRVVVYGGSPGMGYIARFSEELDEKEVNTYPGMAYGPARGSMGSSGVLWTGPTNGQSRFYEWAPPSDW